jgi:hypothetical protein
VSDEAAFGTMQAQLAAQVGAAVLPDTMMYITYQGGVCALDKRTGKLAPMGRVNVTLCGRGPHCGCSRHVWPR